MHAIRHALQLHLKIDGDLTKMSDHLIPADPFAKLPMTFRVNEFSLLRFTSGIDIQPKINAFIASMRERGFVVSVQPEAGSDYTLFTINKPSNPETK